MALAPALLDDLLGVVGVQVQVQGVVRVVDVADLALAGVVDGVAGEEAEAVLFKARGPDAHLLGVGEAMVLEDAPEREVAVTRAELVDLALGRDADNVRTRAASVRERLAGQDPPCGLRRRVRG